MSSHLRHIAIIPDGNRRWAREHGKPSMEGHRYAVEETFPKLFDTVQELGIEYCTVWLLSPENFTKREQAEIKNILMLLNIFLRKRINELDRKQVRMHVIGDISVLPESTQKELSAAIERTKNNTKTVVTFAINYGGRDEIVRALHKMRNEELAMPAGRQEMRNVTKNDISKYLDTSDMPDPDLIIRTGGEKRTSGFMLWQSEYAEYDFTDTLFPDFSPEHLRASVEEFKNRKRRFGK